MTSQNEEKLTHGLAVLPPYCSQQRWAELTGQSYEAVKRQVADGKLSVVNLNENMPDAKRRHLMINVRKELARAEKSEF